MFRRLRRKNKEIPREECIALLTKERRGVLAVNGDDGYPYAMPMNHFFNPVDECIYFHCGRGGHRLDALLRSPKASFCVCEQGTGEGDGWALTVRSVVVFGSVKIIDDADTVSRIARALSHKFTDDEEYIENEIGQFGAATLLLCLEPAHICGKRVTES